MMLRMSLAFADQAPSRVAVALRAGNLSRATGGPKLDRLSDDLDEALATVLAWVTALNAHDRHTRGHSERVRALTEVIGEEMACAVPSSNASGGARCSTTSAS